MRRVLPLLFKSATFRRLTMTDGVYRGDRVTAERATYSLGDIIACTVIEDIAASPEMIAPLDPLPCPITLAWAEKDRIVPLEVCGPIARERLPHANLIVIPGVGHEPMPQAPGLAARTILESVSAESESED